MLFKGNSAIMYDLSITAVRAIDPETGFDKIVNIGIKNRTIAAIGSECKPAEHTLNGEGLVAAPGFIDIHAHEDASTFKSTQPSLPVFTAQCALKTGYTTIVTGNCGMSNLSIEQYRQGVLEHDFPIHCHSLIGNVALRHLAGLENYDTATPDQISHMVFLCREAFEQGALGISFGLQYAPGTGFEEAAALCRVAASYDRYAAVHMRYDYPEKALDAVEEVVRLAKTTGVGVQISHLSANVYGKDNIKKAADMIAHSGLDISCDVYPYNVWATSVQSAVFDNGFGNFNFNVEDLEILTGDYAGQYCTDSLFRQLRTSQHDVMVACHNAMPIEDVKAAYRLPFAMVGSDGQIERTPFGVFLGHPRGAGSPAKFLREYVREYKLFDLSEGIKKLTLLPAQRCKLGRKGRLQIGCDADIVLFDDKRIAENAAFGPDVCAKPPDGIACVVVDGDIRYLPENIQVF